MYVCGLVGPSGTGKSHRALWVAKEHDIDYIIDDGLLICGNGIVAGKSAKREKTRVGAVKTAVFTDDDHTFEVAQALKLRNVERLLILGTSDGMVAKIAKRLGLHGIDETVEVTLEVALKRGIVEQLEHELVGINALFNVDTYFQSVDVSFVTQI